MLAPLTADIVTVAEQVHQFGVGSESAPCEVGTADPADRTVRPARSTELQMEHRALGCRRYAQLHILRLHQMAQRLRISRGSREAHRNP